MATRTEFWTRMRARALRPKLGQAFYACLVIQVGNIRAYSCGDKTDRLVYW